MCEFTFLMLMAMTALCISTLVIIRDPGVPQCPCSAYRLMRREQNVKFEVD